MSTHNVINQAGPLPITNTISPEIIGDATLVVAGSVWTQTQDTMIGFNILLDGQKVGVAEIWSNGTATHRAVVPQHIPIQLEKQWTNHGVDTPPTPASYTLTLEAMNAETIGDLNDRFTVTIAGG